MRLHGGVFIPDPGQAQNPAWTRDPHQKSMSSNIEEKVVVILDGGNATGDAIARRLAEDGAAIVLGGADLGAIEELATELRWNGSRVVTRVTDMTQRFQVSALIAAAIDTFGRVDAMINNPMPTDGLLPGENDPEDVVTGLHVLGALHGGLSAFGYMKARGTGHIVNVAPPTMLTNGKANRYDEATNYALSRLSIFLRSRAEEHGIRVTFVAARPSYGNPDVAIAEHLDKSFRIEPAIHTASLARAVTFAVGQPRDVEINEILFRQFWANFDPCETSP